MPHPDPRQHIATKEHLSILYDQIERTIESIDERLESEDLDNSEVSQLEEEKDYWMTLQSDIDVAATNIFGESL